MIDFTLQYINGSTLLASNYFLLKTITLVLSHQQGGEQQLHHPYETLKYILAKRKRIEFTFVLVIAIQEIYS